MNKKTRNIRALIILILTVIIFGIFISQLMKIQIVNAEKYKNARNVRLIDSQIIKAARGEITDSSGVILAGNQMGFDVIIDKAFFPADKDEQNRTILDIINLLESLGIQWNDNLPVSHTKPFAFKNDAEREIKRLKSSVGTQDFASAEDVMYWLFDNYGLTKYSTEDARKIASVRYDMEQRDFSYKYSYTIAVNVELSAIIKIKEHSFKLPGVDVTDSNVRYYPHGDFAPHIIGSVGYIYPEEYESLKEKGYSLSDLVGRSGVEASLEEYLRGTDGKREIFTDNSGSVIGDVESVSPVPGNTIALTLDYGLQKIAQDSLKAQIDFLAATAPIGQGREANAGAVVAIEVKTGKVKAAATYPSYDLDTYKNNYQSLISTKPEPLLNRAVTGQYMPGSIFKPVVAVSGLHTGVIDESSTVNCTRVYTYLSTHFGSSYTPTCLSHHGHISVNSAISLSCNIFFYDVGRRVGIETIDDIARQLGLGESTGIELAEAPGRRSNPETLKAMTGEKWGVGDVVQSSIGQLMHEYSPLQLANYAATIANGGKRMKLTIIDTVYDYTRGNVIKPFTPEIAYEMTEVDPLVFEIVTRGMVSTSRTGSGRGTFANYPLDVAAKTGTPESIDLPNSTFICFAPAEDPQLAIAVIIEKGWHGYTGAPVAKAIFDEYFGITDVRAPNPSGPQMMLDQRKLEAEQAAEGTEEEQASTQGRDSEAATATDKPAQ